MRSGRPVAERLALGLAVLAGLGLLVGGVGAGGWIGAAVAAGRSVPTPAPEDYRFLGEMRLPWSTAESLKLADDWRRHWSRPEGTPGARGLAWDFLPMVTPSPTRTQVIELLAPSSGYVTVRWSATTPGYGNYVDIQQEDNDGWGVRLAHLQHATPKPTVSGYRRGYRLGIWVAPGGIPLTSIWSCSGMAKPRLRWRPPRRGRGTSGCPRMPCLLGWPGTS